MVPDRDLVVVTQASFSSATSDFAPGDTALNQVLYSLIAPAFG